MNRCNNTVRLINLLNAFREDKTDGLIDHGCESVLAYIWEKNTKQDCCTVSDLVRGENFGAAPTVQRTIDKLQRGGFIVYEKCSSDLRMKCIKLSHRTIYYFEELATYIEHG